MGAIIPVPRPFALGIVTREISGRDEEEDDDDDEGGAEGDGAKAADRAVGVAGTGRSDEDGGDEGGLLGWSVVRHVFAIGVIICDISL